MDREIFVEKKNGLINFIDESMARIDISELDKCALIKLLALINKYTFENRLQQKGLLSHTIVDSLELDYYLAEKFINFDDAIK